MNFKKIKGLLHFSEIFIIGGVMVSMLDSSAVYIVFEPLLGQTKDYIKLVFPASPLKASNFKE